MSEPSEEKPGKRPFLGITFECCRVYWRIYLTKDRKRFAGHCPRCGTPVSVPVGPGGSKDQFYRVS